MVEKFCWFVSGKGTVNLIWCWWKVYFSRSANTPGNLYQVLPYMEEIIPVMECDNAWVYYNSLKGSYIFKVSDRFLNINAVTAHLVPEVF